MSIEQMDAEVARFQAEISSVERAPPSFEEVWPAVEAELAEAEAVFRRIGPQLSQRSVPMLPEYVWQRNQVVIGATLVANRKAVVDSERARIKAQTEGGISATDKQRRLDQIRTAVLRASANRELLLRATEVEGEFKPRPPLHAELTVFRRAALEELAR